MATPADADPVFSTLGPRMSLFTPQNPAADQLVILCTWLGAGKKHIAKYAGGYRKIAPRAKILLIESTVWIIASPYPRQWEVIKPAAEVVRAVLSDCGDLTGSSVKPNIMIHTFSNGGNNSATQLLIVLQKQLGYALPVIGILCDSGPARGTYRKSFQSMLLSLPKGLFWRLIGPIVILFVTNVLFGSQLIGWEKPERIYRRTLLDQKFVNCRRICYAFSKADSHVDWDDITSHADDARRKNWDVKELEFADTPHCNHISKYRAEYFHAMGRVWGGGSLAPASRALL
ncbi:indole-diterpene biosynthesis protein-like protein PaxU [Cucurbitaria berberidis CBS 394.84]|uniref:Indole-diterpene biosynthesis protein-like protein PaxU n=1 Tax=Cucurbitaria berberidis CBS 394.84 TaxID=1168544 RepID=A0A9P4GFG3_9PLEO|nr:indole-diterpene biosynthesis protein-like protein PaxU [Cucurbitaria berberidis CBS 394.84]KAF1845088.1 indole-diterpene biosynthesis protein-like protein PaxU [Cucurbitaria berberidis CBS 394.84]